MLRLVTPTVRGRPKLREPIPTPRIGTAKAADLVSRKFLSVSSQVWDKGLLRGKAGSAESSVKLLLALLCLRPTAESLELARWHCHVQRSLHFQLLDSRGPGSAPPYSSLSVDIHLPDIGADLTLWRIPNKSTVKHAPIGTSDNTNGFVGSGVCATTFSQLSFSLRFEKVCIVFAAWPLYDRSDDINM